MWCVEEHGCDSGEQCRWAAGEGRRGAQLPPSPGAGCSAGVSNLQSLPADSAQPCLPAAHFMWILPLKVQFPRGQENVREPSPVPSVKEQNKELNN